MRLSVFSALSPCIIGRWLAGWLAQGWLAGLGWTRLAACRSQRAQAGSSASASSSSCSLLLTLPQALSSFMRAIDAQSATVQKARYLADMEQP